MYKSIKKRYSYNILFCIGIILSTFFLFWKANYGFGKRDEAFYLILTNRLVQGDAMFVDEQHISQVFSFFLYPVMLLYYGIFKSSEGIIIFFRYIYILFQLLNTVFIHRRLKKYSELGSIVSSLSFLLFAPFNIMALSYNTIGIGCLTVSLVLYLTDNGLIDVFLCGLFYAVAVLCNPYLAIVYFFVTIFLFMKKNNAFITIKEWLYLTLGIFVLAFIFIQFVLSRASLSGIISAIPDILNDPQYPYIPFYKRILLFFYYAFFYSNIASITSIVVLVMMVICSLHTKGKNYIMIIIAICTIVNYVYLGFTSQQINLLLLPINMFCLCVFVLYHDRIKNKRMLAYQLVSLFYSFCISMSSDTGVYGLSSALCVCLVINIVIVFMLLNNDNFNKKGEVIIKATIVVFLISLFVFRSMYVFNGQSILSCNYIIKNGSHKNTIVQEQYFVKYNEELEDIQYIEDHYNGDSILVLSDDLWVYLIASKYKVASPSAWKTINYYKNVYVDYLDAYYEKNNNKIPDIVYVGKGFEDSVKSLSIYKNYECFYTSNNTMILVLNK